MALQRMPRVGELIRFPYFKTDKVLTVHHIEKNIVWCTQPDGSMTCFIGQFPRDESFNNLATIVDAAGKEVP